MHARLTCGQKQVTANSVQVLNGEESDDQENYETDTDFLLSLYIYSKIIREFYIK